VTPEQGELLTQIEMLINAEIPKLDYPDFKPGRVPDDIRASREFDAQRQAVAKTYNRFATPAPPPSALPPVAGQRASSAPVDVDPSKFPGGIVPSRLPEKRMGGRVRSARSMKQAIAQTLAAGAPAPTAAQPTPEGPGPA
jgi:hypothetical protein